MKYTKEQLQSMSDFEVNEVLAELVGLNVLHDVDPLHSKTAAVYHNGCNAEEYNGTNIDYCNTPNDIMPLAFEHEITITTQAEAFYGGDFVYDRKHPSYNKGLLESKWVACERLDADYDRQIYSSEHAAAYCDDKPLRAIACCLILVLQGEKE